MPEPIFFKIPIYRCTKETHTKYMEKERNKFILIEDKEESPISYQNGIVLFQDEKWYPWKYNERIGYLNLFIFGTQLRADTWFIAKKRINKGIIKKKFILVAKSFEKEIPLNKNSDDVFKFILNTLITYNKTKFKKFHFDLSTFKVTGKFVNWIELTKKLNSFNYPKFRQEYFKENS